ncbi:Smr/MutS family protein [Altererythrobacter sp. ZODW24]|uniref:Smr/MutS family protein n=1 Tax=Altererythrobacter sp. ZODW24 TaxID=2185142 RepID=UPI000DF76A94|nr:Smr/MutS family protein [Altererythrobacter sp. ZODW24]
MKPPRGLSADEAALWEKVASTVEPLQRRPMAPSAQKRAVAIPQATPMTMPVPKSQRGRIPPPAPPKPVPAPVPRNDRTGLDSSWERKLSKASIDPDYTLDLHGHTLDQAYVRLNRGIAQARAMNARLILVITGKSRPVDAADRGSSRGAIRAKILDWLAAGSHGSAIAAIRKAHRRHGGEGALYIVLKRER